MIDIVKGIIIKDSKKAALVIDYDRTLVNDDKQVMEKTKEMIIKFQRNRGTVVIASGRPFSGLVNICKELKLDIYGGYVIGCNGASIVSVKDGELIYDSKIESRELDEILTNLEILPLKKGVVTDTHLIVDDETNDLHDEANSNDLIMLIDKEEQKKVQASKIVFSLTRETTHDYYDRVVEILGDDYNVVKSSPRYIEVTKKGTDKGLSLNRLLKHINLSSTHLIGIGDSQNDITTLQACEIAIGMGNSTQEVKDICHIIIDSNQNDGIGKFLSDIYYS